MTQLGKKAANTRVCGMGYVVCGMGLSTGRQFCDPAGEDSWNMGFAVWGYGSMGYTNFYSYCSCLEV